jgi:subtilisin family serine protease
MGATPTVWETTGLSALTDPTPQGDLATWSTDTVADGTWTIRLVVDGGAGGRREVRRTVVVDNTGAKRDLVVDVATESEGLGTVQVTPPRAFCDGSASGPQSCTYSIDQGAEVTLTAIPDKLSTFAGWTGACTGVSTCTVTMSQARQVRALFKGPRRLVLVLRQVRFGAGNLVVSPGEHVCNPGETCTFRFKIGTTITLRAFPFDPPALPGGTSFSWDPGQPCESNECTLVLNDHLTLRGEFAEQPEEPSVGLCCSQTVTRGTVVDLFAFPVSPDGTIVHVQWFELIFGPGGSVTRVVLLDSPDAFPSEYFLETPTVGVRTIGLAVDDSFSHHAEEVVTITVVEPGAAAAAAAAPAKAPPGEPLWPLGPRTTGASSRLVVKMREATAGGDIGRRLLAKITGKPAAEGRATVRPVFPPGPATVATLGGGRQKRAHRGAVRPRVDRTYVVDLPPGVAVDDALGRLAKDPEVDYAQVDHPREVQAVPPSYFWNLAGSWGQPYDDLWALKKLDLVEAWDQTRGENVTVAVVDSGVDVGHPDLALLDNPERTPGAPGFDDDGNGFVDDVNGWNFVADNADVQDRYGHGTHVAGIVAANPDRRGGLAGVAPLVKLLAVKAVDDSGRATSSRLAAGIVYAVGKGADIVLVPSACSTRCPTDPVMEDAVRYAAASGVVVIVPAGNQGDDTRYYSPQNMQGPRPIVVAATDQLDRRESFSNFGDFVDLSAPGGGTNVAPPAFQPVLNILSTKSSTCAPAVCSAGLVVSAGGEPSYLRRAGTSMAAAYATGVAALVLSRHPELGIDELRHRLTGNAKDLGPFSYDPMFGSGRLQGGATLADTTVFATSRILSPGEGETVSGLVRITGVADARSLFEYFVDVWQGSSPPTRVITSKEAVANGELAIWDTSGAADGPWTVRLTVNQVGYGFLESRRTVIVDNSRPRRLLTLDLAADPGAAGSVEVAPPRAFCDAVSATTHTCSYSLPSDTTATLTALPGPLSVFAGWSGACTGTGTTCTVSMAAARTARATFRRVPTVRLSISLQSVYTAVVQVSPPGEMCNEPGCTFDYLPGTVVHLQTPYGFSVSWDPGPCEGQPYFCALTMDRDISLHGTN